MKKVLIISGCVLLALGVVCGVIAMRVYKLIIPEPEIKEVVVPDSTVVCGAYSNPLLCFLSIAKNKAGMGGAHLDAYKYLSGAELYRLELIIGSFTEDSLLGDFICFYYEQRDSILYDSSLAPELCIQSVYPNDKHAQMKILLYCYSADYLDDIFAQPITEIGINTSNQGLVKFPMRTKATEELAQRYSLLKDYIAQH